MKIEEAIEHCLLKTEQDCSSCGAEHKQLAEWLKELKDRRAADVAPVVRCKDCKHRRDDEDYVCGHYCVKRPSNGGYFCEDNDFCSYGERRSE